MSDFKPYQYLPIEGERSIRLLVLQHAKRKEQALQCDIVHISLDGQPDYDALSYTWNNETPQLPLICPGGTQILITPNCAAALRKLRRKAKFRRLWVDSVCIDQATVDERNAQVTMMADIYRSATQVAVWLGLGDPDSKIAFRYIRRAQFIFNHDRKKWLSKALGKKGLFSFKMLLTGCKPKSLVSLTERSYWTRIWTLQEFAGSNPVVYCGDSKPISALYLTTVLKDLPQIDGIAITGMLKTLFHLRCYEQFHVRESSLFDGFQLISRMSSSDPRDKVYAMKGLFTQTLTGLEVDYNKSPHEVFLEATRAAIINDRSLEVLQYLTRKSSALESPSWVVNWDNKDLLVRREYKASKVSRPLYHFPSSDTSLLLHGREVDTVAENISLLLPDFDIYALGYSYNGHSITEEDASRIFIQAVCGLYTSSAKTFFSSFQAYFRNVMQFLLADEEYPLSRIDSLLAFDLEQGELPPADIRRGICPLEACNSVLFMTTNGRFGLSREGIRPGDILALFSGVDKPFIVRPTGISYFLICAAIVSGMMEGELWPSDESSLTKFRII